MVYDKEVYRRYYERHKEEIRRRKRELQAKKRAENPDLFRQRNREYYQKHREKFREYYRTHRKTHPCKDCGKPCDIRAERCSSCAKRYLAKIRPHQLSEEARKRISEIRRQEWNSGKRKRNPRNVLRAKLAQASDFKCELCGERKPLHLHHIIRTREGGEDSERNCIVVCARCHDLLERELDARGFPKHVELQRKVPRVSNAIMQSLQNRETNILV
ncbi:MAG: HNH endonuclease [Fervidobacterium sp.]